MSFVFNVDDPTHVSAALIRDITKRHYFAEGGTLDKKMIGTRQKGIKKAEKRDYLYCPVCGIQLREGAEVILIKQHAGGKKETCICDKQDCLNKHEEAEKEVFGCQDVENIPDLPRDIKLKKCNLEAWYSQRLAVTTQNRNDRALEAAGLP